MMWIQLIPFMLLGLVRSPKTLVDNPLYIFALWSVTRVHYYHFFWGVGTMYLHISDVCSHIMKLHDV